MYNSDGSIYRIRKKSSGTINFLIFGKYEVLYIGESLFNFLLDMEDAWVIMA